MSPHNITVCTQSFAGTLKHSVGLTGSLSQIGALQSMQQTLKPLYAGFSDFGDSYR